MTDFEVTRGESFEFDYELQNVGDTDATKDAILKIGGTEEDRDSDVSVPKNGGRTSGTLVWDVPGSISLGTKSVTLESGTRTDTAQIDVVASADFNVVITGTNGPVAEGQDLTVDANVTNQGNSTDSQVITLDARGEFRDSQSLVLDPGETGSVTLTWETSFGDEGSRTVTVNSVDDSDSTTVTIQDTTTSLPESYEYNISLDQVYSDPGNQGAFGTIFEKTTARASDGSKSLRTFNGTGTIETDNYDVGYGTFLIDLYIPTGVTDGELQIQFTSGGNFNHIWRFVLYSGADDVIADIDNRSDNTDTLASINLPRGSWFTPTLTATANKCKFEFGQTVAESPGSASDSSILFYQKFGSNDSEEIFIDNLRPT